MSRLSKLASLRSPTSIARVGAVTDAEHSGAEVLLVAATGCIMGLGLTQAFYNATVIPVMLEDWKEEKETLWKEEEKP